MSMMRQASDLSQRTLSPNIREQLAKDVEGAQSRGWTSNDLGAWFQRQGVTPGHATRGIRDGLPVDESSFHALGGIYVRGGMPRWPFEPNPEAIRSHLEWLMQPTPSDDALVEIAYDEMDNPDIKNARLFEWQEFDQAVQFAVAKNTEGRNVYVGAALRSPSSSRSKRCTGEDFYVATAVPVDIDRDYDAIRTRMGEVCEDGLVVTTGLTPERRSQHWVRLEEPCEDPDEFAHAFASLVTHVGGDPKVKDAARIMRLGGTLSFPSRKKRDKGYLIELTTVRVDDQARPSAIEDLVALAPHAYARSAGDDATRPHNTSSANEIIRDPLSGQVKDGREAYWRNLVLGKIEEFQKENGADPTEDEVFEAAFATFSHPVYVDNSDGRWTSEKGIKQLRQRVRNTLRRLRSGKLAKHELYSIETGAGSEGCYQARTEAAPGPADQDGSNPQAESPPPVSAHEPVFDPWDKYVVPEFPLEILPPSVQRFVTTHSAVIGCDQSALAMACLCNFSGALDHRFALKMMPTGAWCASPRLWVLLVGDPSRKKTPVIQAATRDLEAAQSELRDAYDRDIAAHKAAGGKDEDSPAAPPRYVVGDTTIEKLGEILARHDRGTLIKRDELSGWIGGMEKYGGRGGAADRAFWLQAFDGGPYIIDRISRGEIRVRNLSVSLIGGIQPARLAELRGLTSDGLLQRFIPVMLGPSQFPQNKLTDQPFNQYRQLTRALLGSRPERLIMEDDAYECSEALRRYLFDVEQSSGGLAQGSQAFVGKLPGLAGSLALILHMVAAPQEGGFRRVTRRTWENVDRLVREFILPHAFEFYRSAETVTEGDRLQRIASWILTSGKTRIVSSDLTRNVAGLQGLTLFDVNQRLSPLVAGGWLSAVERGPVSRSWAVTPGVFAQFEERARIEEERKRELAELMRSPRKKTRGGHAC